MVVIVSVVAAVGVAVVVIGAWLQRRIVEHARVRVDANQARVDDALRASAVRAVHHATVGLLLCGIAFVGVTGATWGPIGVQVDNTSHFEIAPGATDVVQAENQIWWTDFGGARHTRILPSGQGHFTGWMQTYESDVISSVGALLALLAGLGALFAWREAARAWRRPGPRRRARLPDRELSAGAAQ